MNRLLMRTWNVLQWRVPLYWCAVVALPLLAIAILHVRTAPPPAPEDPLKTVTARVNSLGTNQKAKVCAHRSNNVPKYRAAKAAFSCVEIDVVIAPDTGGPASVYHPPVENHHGLALDFLLGHEGMPQGKLWLDVKDLGPDTWHPFLELISELIPPERRADAVVETSWGDSSIRPVVASYRGRGFLVSYYLPTEQAIDCGVATSPECESFRDQVIESVSMGFSHLSFDAEARDFVDSIRDRLPPQVRLLTWDLARAWPNLDLIDDVDIYIVGFPSPYST